MRIVKSVIVACVVLSTVGLAGEIQFVEEFALAEKREETLKQLIPGTREYYYYHSLHYLNTGAFEKVDEILKPWIKRYGHSSQVELMRNRLALLRYEKQPAKSLEFLKWRMGLRFNHERELLDAKPTYPTKLDQNLISFPRLLANAFMQYQDLSGITDSGLESIDTGRLDPNRLRNYLSRLRRPDVPGLAALVVKDLRHRHGGRFGMHKIHSELLGSQLEECARLMPELRRSNDFVNAWLLRLAPGPDTDWRHDAEAREAYLERLWNFASSLEPVHNSLKANILYRRLVHDRGKGVYDKERFMAYIRLPRPVNYINPVYLKETRRTSRAVHMGADFKQVISMPPIRNDETIVRSYLSHFFLTENSVDSYSRYIREDWLKRVMAETKIVNGLGEMEKWYELLNSPAYYQQLKDRVDIDFAPTNKNYFRADEAVALDLYIKNIETLLVKVFEVNTLNYYRQSRSGDTNDINLDGFVANHEETHVYKETPLKRVKRHFELPMLKKPGLYFVEFIGNGRSNRVLVRKGALNFVERRSINGHVFTVFDEQRKKVDNAALWLGGHRYDASEDGTILVPYTTKPSSASVVLTSGNFASRATFSHLGEQYRFAAGIYVDREDLLKGSNATVLIRPALYLQDTPVTLSVLKEAKMTIVTVDGRGVRSSKEIKNIKLLEGKESLYEFGVPDDLRTISFNLRAKVRIQSRAKDEWLSDSMSLRLNGVNQTDKIEMLFLTCEDGKYIIELRGKTGEPKADRPVKLVLQHRAFKEQVHLSLQTDAAGRIHLGLLKDVVTVSASGPEGTGEKWYLPHSNCRYPGRINRSIGEVIEVPYLGEAGKPVRSELSLLAKSGKRFSKDMFEFLAIKNGFVTISKLPVGDYSLRLKQQKMSIAISITDGPEMAGFALGENRVLQKINATPLQIESVGFVRGEATIRLRNANEFTRVHLIATRYLPDHKLFASLGKPWFPYPESIGLTKGETVYLAGREIGEEYRYILERRQAAKFPGNMLKRPSLLLNPWAISDSSTTSRDAADGGRFGSRHGGRRRMVSRGGGSRATSSYIHRWFASFDFLPKSAFTSLNLVPDKDGAIKVKVPAGKSFVRVIAIDPENTVSRQFSVAGTPLKAKNLRLTSPLDPEKHFFQQRKVAVLKPGESLAIGGGSDYEVYDSLAKVYQLFATLSGDSKLAEFGFILKWPEMKEEEKREKYSKYACHELHLFLASKDRKFFDEVVKPYLVNKKDKTFMDHYLTSADLSAYLDPWRFGQLNVVERALLGLRIGAESKQVGRHLKDLNDLIPPDIERFNHLFETALKSSDLEASGAGDLAFGYDDDAVAEKEEAAGPVSEAAKPRAPAQARKASRSVLRDRMAEKKKEKADGKSRAKNGYFAADKATIAGREIRRLYRQVDKTREWVENNYYKLPIGRQNASLITINNFWKDFGLREQESFVSPHIAEASGSFAEMMLALSLLDLPFAAQKHAVDAGKDEVNIKAASPAIVYYKGVTAIPAEKKSAILVSQNIFRNGDRYRYEDNEKVDKFISEEFLVNVVYGCQVAVTNPTSSRQKLDLLLQIPAGALPVRNGFYTRGVHLRLPPYGTRTIEYYFYFPSSGEQKHFPVHVARNSRLIAFAAPALFKVVEKPSKVDTTVWDYISQYGSPEDTIKFMSTHNLGRVKLERAAWRMKEKGFFDKAIEVLRQRKVYQHTLWSYSILHNQLPAITEFLQHDTGFISQCGPYIKSKLVTIDPVLRRSYQHMEYSPLVNARAHRLGRKKSILNNRFNQQYHRLMNILACRDSLSAADNMSVVYYLLLQDRTEEAIKRFGTIDAKALATTIQYDYMQAYLDFFHPKPALAPKIARKYRDYPVERWRKAFSAISVQLDEISGKAGAVVDPDDRDQDTARLAATEPSFDFKVEGRKISLQYRNVEQVTVRYYTMDIELLFSRSPFVQKKGGQFSYIRPNHEQTLALRKRAKEMSFDLPEQFRNSNVMIEISSAGITRAQACYANSMSVQVVENYGQVRVTDAGTRKPVAKVYVKVYARMKDGQVKFYKDGYTDLRGWFEYSSLSTNQLDSVERFSILVMSENAGAVIKEAAPPKR